MISSSRVQSVYSCYRTFSGANVSGLKSWDFMWNLVKSCYFSLRLWFCNCLQLSWFYFHKNGGEFVKSWDISVGYHNISHQIWSFCEKLRNLEIFWEWLVNCDPENNLGRKIYFPEHTSIGDQGAKTCLRLCHMYSFLWPSLMLHLCLPLLFVRCARASI